MRGLDGDGNGASVLVTGAWTILATRIEAVGMQ
jgi:hypothetical protein